MLNCELSTNEELEALIEKTDGFCIGAPTLGGHMPTPVSNALGVIVKESTREYPAGVFGSFGWSGEAVDLMEARLKDGGFDFAFAPIRCKFKPTQETLQICEESGTDLGQVLTKKETLKAMKNAMSPDVAKALGRVSGGLYVVTAAQGTAKSAMIASWIAQASFEPLGFTVAIAKDRAIESLMQVGDKFVLNCLPEDNFEGLMKHFLIRFPPGADRFEGVEWAPASCGAPILKEAAAYMECTVTSRMEAADHWIVYSEVRDGKVFKDEKTATHHRKVASYY